MTTEPLTEVVPMRLTHTQLMQAKALAAQDQRPLSQWLRVQVIQLLKQQQEVEHG